MSGIGAACLAVDWGTSNLRVWALDSTGKVLAEAGSDRGMNRLPNPAAFEEALLDLVQSWLCPDTILPVAICGMAGARNGWREAPYRAVPCMPVEPDALTPVTLADPRLKVAIVPGLCNADPPDVMRGEETPLAGWIALHPDFQGTICLPGTHSKWVALGDGMVQRFKTVMTGEIFDLLAKQSILRLTATTGGWDAQAFAKGVRDGFARPGQVVTDLFHLRAGPLLQNWPAEQVRARLSGLLIGAELAGVREYWSGEAVHIIGDANLARLYQDALILLGAEAQVEKASDLTLQGLAVAARNWQEGAAHA